MPWGAGWAGAFAGTEPVQAPASLPPPPSPSPLCPISGWLPRWTLLGAVTTSQGGDRLNSHCLWSSHPTSPAAHNPFFLHSQVTCNAESGSGAPPRAGRVRSLRWKTGSDVQA